MCCSVLQCVAVCCSVLQCVYKRGAFDEATILMCVAVYCGVLQCVAVCCIVLQCVAAGVSVLQCVAVCMQERCFRQGDNVSFVSRKESSMKKRDKTTTSLLYQEQSPLYERNYI